MIKIGSCFRCNKDLGIFTPKVSLKNAYMCKECFEAAGFSFDDKKAVAAFADVIHQNFESVRKELLGNGNGAPDWNNPDYVLREVRQLLVSFPKIALKDKELCYFHAQGELGKKKTRTVRNGKKSHKETYFEKTPCEFYMTSERFIAIVPKGSGFVINHGGVLALTLHKDALEINRNGKANVVFLRASDIDRYKKTWRVLDKAKSLNIQIEDITGENKQKKKAEKENVEVVFENPIATDYEVIGDEGDSLLDELLPSETENEKPEAKSETKEPDIVVEKKTEKPEKSSNNNLDPVNEIRRYKSLLDDGIITQEDFDKKKQQLLDL